MAQPCHLAQARGLCQVAFSDVSSHTCISSIERGKNSCKTDQLPGQLDGGASPRGVIGAARGRR